MGLRYRVQVNNIYIKMKLFDLHSKSEWRISMCCRWPKSIHPHVGREVPFAKSSRPLTGITSRRYVLQRLNFTACISLPR